MSLVATTNGSGRPHTQIFMRGRRWRGAVSRRRKCQMRRRAVSTAQLAALPAINAPLGCRRVPELPAQRQQDPARPLLAPGTPLRLRRYPADQGGWALPHTPQQSPVCRGRPRCKVRRASASCGAAQRARVQPATAASRAGAWGWRRPAPRRGAGGAGRRQMAGAARVTQPARTGQSWRGLSVGRMVGSFIRAVTAEAGGAKSEG